MGMSTSEMEVEEGIGGTAEVNWRRNDVIYCCSRGRAVRDRNITASDKKGWRYEKSKQLGR
jgi:hypothetical protein